MTDLQRDIHWNTRLEEYFTQTGEKASGLSWCHKRAEEMFSRKTVFIDLPVIILSTLNGAVSVGSTSLFGNNDMASVGVGAVALVTAILSTIGSYFAWARRAEAHKISSLNYAKLYRFLSIEMSLPRRERMTPTDLLKYVKSEYDRLSEISPLVPPSIIDLFRKRFAAVRDISFPEECNGLHAISIYQENSGDVIKPEPVVEKKDERPQTVPEVDLHHADAAHPGSGTVRHEEESRLPSAVVLSVGAED